MATLQDLKDTYVKYTGSYPSRLDSYTGLVTDQDIQNVIDSAGGAPTGGTTGGTTAGTVTPQDILDVFDQYGVDAQTDNETALERATRIAESINTGTRTLDEVTNTIAGIGSGNIPNLGNPNILGPTGSTAGIDLVGLGGHPEIWLNSDTGQYLVVHYIPDTNPPVPYYYTATEQEIQGAFGPQQIVTDRQVTTDQLRSAGALPWGTFSQIDPNVDDPFADWTNAVTKQAAIRPWLRDPEVLRLMAEAMVEGRDLSDAELQQTTWWRSHNDAERAWMLLYESDPRTAQQKIDSNRTLIADMTRSAGVANAPQSIIDYIANQFTMGHWSEAYAQLQIRGLSDPAAGVDIDQGLLNVLNGGVAGTAGGLDTTQAKEEDVRTLVQRWLGPTYGNWSDAQISEWAGKLRNDPDAETQLIEMLRNQRLTLFPQYDNPALTYEDIAGPWKTLWSNEWGQVADETDPLFNDIMSRNDLAYARSQLRTEGLKRDNPTVMQQMLTGLEQVAGGKVRSFL